MNEANFSDIRNQTFSYVSSLIEQAKEVPSPLKKRSTALDALEQCVSNVVHYKDVLRAAKCPPKYKKRLTVLINLLNSASSSISKDMMNFSEIRLLITEEIASALSDLEILVATHSYDEQTEDDRVSAENNNEEKHVLELRARLISFKKRYLPKIPYKLVNESGAQVTTLPLSASLSIPLNYALLQTLGIPIEPFSSNGHGSDLGYLMKDQTVLMFSRSVAERVAGEVVKEMKAESSESRNNEYLKATRKKLRQTKKSLEEMQRPTKRMTMKAQASHEKTRKALVREVKRLEEDVERYKTLSKPSKRQRVAERGLKNTSNIYVSTACQILETISQNTGVDQVLVSNEFKVNPHNSDILMFWFMPGANYKTLLNMTGGNFMIDNWDFAWSQTLDADDDLKSIGLPTKIKQH